MPERSAGRLGWGRFERGRGRDLTLMETINRRDGLSLYEAPCGLLKERVWE